MGTTLGSPFLCIPPPPNQPSSNSPECIQNLYTSRHLHLLSSSHTHHSLWALAVTASLFLPPTLSPSYNQTVGPLGISFSGIKVPWQEKVFSPCSLLPVLNRLGFMELSLPPCAWGERRENYGPVTRSSVMLNFLC